MPCYQHIVLCHPSPQANACNKHYKGHNNNAIKNQNHKWVNCTSYGGRVFKPRLATWQCSSDSCLKWRRPVIFMFLAKPTDPKVYTSKNVWLSPLTSSRLCHCTGACNLHLCMMRAHWVICIFVNYIHGIKYSYLHVDDLSICHVFTRVFFTLQ